MEWDVKLYQNSHAFVAEYGKALLQYLPDDENAAVLDLGCGNGTLTAELAKRYRRVVGIDQSEEMIGAARKNYPGIEFQVIDALNMPFNNEFDAVFSNAVFHWILDQQRLLSQIMKALKPGGRLVCEFGAHGNIGSILDAFHTAMATRGQPASTSFYYPTAEDYTKLLKDVGFEVAKVFIYDRPTPLPGGRDGLRLWMSQFLTSDLNRISENLRDDVIIEVEHALEGTLWDGGVWHADYRRIQAIAEER